mgnify:CR=1 FL=1
MQFNNHTTPSFEFKVTIDNTKQKRGEGIEDDISGKKDEEEDNAEQAVLSDSGDNTKSHKEEDEKTEEREFEPASIHGEAPDGSLMWHVEKMYSGRLSEKVIAERTGIVIRVFMESIGHAVDEFLVDFELLTAIMCDTGLYPASTTSLEKLGLRSHTGMFSELFEDMRDYAAEKGVDGIKDARILNALSMTDTHKRYSFMNRWFVFEKKKTT